MFYIILHNNFIFTTLLFSKNITQISIPFVDLLIEKCQTIWSKIICFQIMDSTIIWNNVLNSLRKPTDIQEYVKTKCQAISYHAEKPNQRNNNVSDLVTASPVLYHFLQKHNPFIWSNIREIQQMHYETRLSLCRSHCDLIKKVNSILFLRAYSS